MTAQREGNDMHDLPELNTNCSETSAASAPSADSELALERRVLQERSAVSREIEVLRASEARYRRMIETANEGVWEFDATYAVRYVNSIGAAMLGYAPAEIVGRNVVEFFFDPAEEETHARMIQRRAAGINEVFERKLRHKSGRPVWAIVSASAKFEASNCFAGSYAMVTDITARKEAEERLQASEAKYRELFEGNNSVQLLSSAHDGAIIDANPAACAFYGYDRETMRRMRLFDINTLPGNELTDALRRARSKNTLLFQFKHRLASGEIRDVEVRTTPIESNGATLLHSIVIDITARCEAEQRLRDSEARYRQLVEAMNEGLATQDRDGILNFVNPAICRMLGYEQNEVIGRRVLDFFTPKSRQLYLEEMLKHSGGVLSIHEATLQRKDGSELPIILSASPLFDKENKFVGSMGICTDINQRLKLEIELDEARRKAEAANSAKSAFLANMSHEIRTPISGVMGALQMLLDTRLDKEQRSTLEMALDSSASLLGLINDILDFSKIEAGKFDLNLCDFHLAGWLSHILAPLRVLAEQKAVAFDWQIADNTPLQLRGDPERLGQILRNIVGNAIKFTNEGGVALHVAPAPSQEPKDASITLEFHVRDTGIGIPEDNRARLFQSFDQLDGTVAKRFGGTGLGLAISKRLVKMMGGDIDVESQPGQGSTFFFNARFEPASAAVSPEPPTHVLARGETPGQSHPSGTRQAATSPARKILLAEDTPLNQKFISHLMRRAGHEVVVVGNGLQALEALARQDFDCVLMDVQMPRMDGIEATRRIRREVSGLFDPNIPIVALTAYAMESDRARTIDAGMNDYVSKPVAPGMLFAALDRVLGTVSRAVKAVANDKGDAVRPDWPALLDRKALVEKLENDVDLYVQLLDIFREELITRAVALEEAGSRGDTRELRFLAHALKSTAGTVGATAIQQLAAEIEHAAKADDIEATVAPLKALAAACPATLTAIEDTRRSLA